MRYRRSGGARHRVEQCRILRLLATVPQVTAEKPRLTLRAYECVGKGRGRASQGCERAAKCWGRSAQGYERARKWCGHCARVLYRGGMASGREVRVDRRRVRGVYRGGRAGGCEVQDDGRRVRALYRGGTAGRREGWVDRPRA